MKAASAHAGIRATAAVRAAPRPGWWAGPLLAVWWVAVGGPACGSESPPVHTPLKAQGADQSGPDCRDIRPEPSLLAWDPEARLKLYDLRTQGLVAVRYRAEGCNVELEVLTHCTRPGEYHYTPYASQDNVRNVIRTVQELYTELPIGASELSGRLRQSGGLRTDQVLVGVAALPVGSSVHVSALQGADCPRATHVVSAIYVGGFALSSGEASVLEASASLFGAGAGVERSQRVERLGGEGSPEQCAQALATGKPMPLCAVPLRIALLPLDRTPLPVCPEGAEWDGEQCVSTNQPPPPVAMVQIPAGTFTMGSNDGRSDEKPPHRVSVKGFEIDQTEVTVAAYDFCVRTGPCAPPDQGLRCNSDHPAKRWHRPVNCVNWHQAKLYCEWVGKRLPTEAEWEYAARGTDGRIYPWGNEPPTPEHFCTGSGTCPVGSTPKGDSAFGLHDMAGNVWEWTSTQYCGDYRPGRRCKRDRVLRGGEQRATRRHHHDLHRQYISLGFRCARSL